MGNIFFLKGTARFLYLQQLYILFVTAVLLSPFAVQFQSQSAYATPSHTNSADGSINTKKDGRVDDEPQVKAQDAYSKLPLYFIQNNGQLDENVRYYEKSSGHATYFTKSGVYLSLVRSRNSGARSHDTEGRTKKTVRTRQSNIEDRLNSQQTTSKLIRLIPLSANKNPEILPEDIQSGKVNHFTGNDPEKWKSNVPTYKSVLYKAIYKNIDMRFYGNNRQIEYDIIVKPGASPSRVQLSYNGVEDVRINENGDMEIFLANSKSEMAKLIQKKPYVYQEIEGKRVEIEGNFRVLSSGSEQSRTNKSSSLATHHSSLLYGFKVAAYDKHYPLVIDPVLEYSTYLGGSNDDGGNCIAIDTSGNIYVVGATSSTDFPTANAIYGNLNNIFITKLNASGSALVYSTYLGGSRGENSLGIAVDASGNIYVTGWTESMDFPMANALYWNYSGGYDVFITKLNASGSGLVYSTYLGGSAGETGYGIAVDVSGNAYVTGNTESTDFPTVNALYESFSGAYYDAFVTKLNALGSALDYSTYLGGSSTDHAFDIAVDTSGNAYVTGETWSTDFPTANALYGTFSGSSDVFVTKLNATGSALDYSTYLGGSSWDGANSIAIDTSENVYVTGYTRSGNFPTANALYGTRSGDFDVFVTKLNATGSALDYSTYLGGNSAEHGNGIAVDTFGNACVTGHTYSTDFPTANAIYGSSNGYVDVFVTRLNATGNSLDFSTYLGGSDSDISSDIAVDTAGNVYVTGRTYSTDFPTVNALYGSNSGYATRDAFVIKISDDAATPEPTPSPSSEPSPVSSPTPEITPTTTPITTAIVTPTPTHVPTPIPTPTPVLTPTPLITPTPTIIPSLSPSPTAETGMIYGYVVDEDGNPIEAVNLKLKGKKTKTKETTSTDANGFFEFKNLEADAYEITAKKKHYKKAKQKIKLGKGEIKEIEITMEKRKKDDPTAVTLIFFSANASESGVVTLTWETATEVNNAGFNIYRSRNKNENYTKVNSTLIPAEGNSTIGASYSFKDTPGNGNFYYKLEDIDNKGVSAMHRQAIVKVKNN